MLAMSCAEVGVGTGMTSCGGRAAVRPPWEAVSGLADRCCQEDAGLSALATGSGRTARDIVRGAADEAWHVTPAGPDSLPKGAGRVGSSSPDDAGRVLGVARRGYLAGNAMFRRY